MVITSKMVRQMQAFSSKAMGWKWSALAAAILAFLPVQGLSEPLRPDIASVAITDASGTTQNLTDIAPQGPLVLHFWATWCGPCRDELPALAAFRENLPGALYERLLVISVDTLPFARVGEYLADELELPDFETLQASPAEAGTAFRIQGYPLTIALDASSEEIFRHSGAVRWDDPAAQAEFIKLLQGADTLAD